VKAGKPRSRPFGLLRGDTIILLYAKRRRNNLGLLREVQDTDDLDLREILSEVFCAHKMALEMSRLRNRKTNVEAGQLTCHNFNSESQIRTLPCENSASSAPLR